MEATNPTSSTLQISKRPGRFIGQLFEELRCSHVEMDIVGYHPPAIARTLVSICGSESGRHDTSG
jgi:hypothetical protein